MGKYEKLMGQILRGGSDANIGFEDLCNLLTRLGVDVRIRGSHHNFFRPGVVERINLQQDGSKAKCYQVRQVREIVIRYGLSKEMN